MENEISISRIVDRYLDGRFDNENLAAFKQRLQHDAQLKEELHHQEQLHKVLETDQEIIELEKQLNAIYIKTYRPLKKTIRLKTTRKKVLFKAASIAAGVALLITIGTQHLNRSGSSSEIFDTYYKPAEINMSFRAAENVVDSELRNAMILYENKQYSEAISLFEEILKADKTRIGLNLYNGISHMEIEQYEQANINFQRVIDHQANAFIESAMWYLGLCYLKTDNTDKATELFTQIIKQQGYYYKEAKKIKKNID